MLSDEEKKAIDLLKNIDKQKCLMLNCPVIKNNIERQLKINELNRIIRKQSKEIEELKREKETNQQMIHLAETQILGYGQGYKDGLNKETTVTEIVARERENQIIYEGMKHKINMEWVFKIKAKIEPKLKELDEQINEEWKKYGNSKELQDMEDMYNFLQSLLEKEGE